MFSISSWKICWMRKMRWSRKEEIELPFFFFFFKTSDIVFLHFYYTVYQRAVCFACTDNKHVDKMLEIRQKEHPLNWGSEFCFNVLSNVTFPVWSSICLLAACSAQVQLVRCTTGTQAEYCSIREVISNLRNVLCNNYAIKPVMDNFTYVVIKPQVWKT